MLARHLALVLDILIVVIVSDTVKKSGQRMGLSVTRLTINFL
jgi:hypothetical protein